MQAFLIASTSTLQSKGWFMLLYQGKSSKIEDTDNPDASASIVHKMLSVGNMICFVDHRGRRISKGPVNVTCLLHTCQHSSCSIYVPLHTQNV